VGERMVIDEVLIATRQSVRNLSSVAGLRALCEIPIEALRREIRKRRHKRKRDRRPSAADARESSPGS